MHRPQELCSWGMLDISHTHRQKVCEWTKSKVTKRDQRWKHISLSWWNVNLICRCLNWGQGQGHVFEDPQQRASHGFQGYIQRSV